MKEYNFEPILSNEVFKANREKHLRMNQQRETEKKIKKAILKGTILGFVISAISITLVSYKILEIM